MDTEKKLDHPCKDTCSGWQQGFEAGEAHATELLASALKKVLAPESWKSLVKVIEHALVDKSGEV